MRRYRRRRSFVALLGHFTWRYIRIFLVAFAAMGPAPPPPPLPRADPTEQRAESAEPLEKLR